MRFINREVPIVEIAKALELRFGSSGHIHCWHPERHAYGDRTASVGISKQTNMVRCFGNACGGKSLGPIDLVIDVLGAKPGEAALWIAARFAVQYVPKGQHTRELPRSRYRVGFEDEMGLLIRTGVWSRLSEAARCIVPVLLQFVEREHGQVSEPLTLSFAAISRYSGVSSPTAVNHALDQLHEIGWLIRPDKHSKRGQGPVRQTNSYRITPNSDVLREFANSCCQQLMSEIAAQKEIRVSQRHNRVKEMVKMPLSDK